MIGRGELTDEEWAICFCLPLVGYLGARVPGNQRFWHTWKRLLFFISKVAEKNRNTALLSDILALSSKKRTRKMSYECLDTRKGCHATL
jgi:hypothetical protein